MTLLKERKNKPRKIFVKDTSDKGLVSRLFNEKHSQSLIVREQAALFLKMDKSINQPVIKENIWMVNNHVRRHSTSLAIKEMQIKTRMRYHHTPIKCLKFRRLTIPSAENEEQLELSWTVVAT